jgi:dolichol-phosphate mannosyltransferase
MSHVLPFGDAPQPRRLLLSLVTPAFNEAENLPTLYRRIGAALSGDEIDWEWIVVDDHSSDGTFASMTRLSETDPRARCVRLARNTGSHAAIMCGLAAARGAAAVVIAADGQDPPEILPALLAEWRAGAQVVWAARESARSETPWTSHLYYRIMRRIAGLSQLAPEGADCVLLDRAVIDAVREFREHHVSLLALITWMGFRQVSVPCPREPRVRGRSGWTRARRMELFVDSITGFTYVPIRVMSYLGVATAAAGFAYAAVVIANAFNGQPPTGWSSLMVVVLLIGGIQMLMLGVLGEYVWRALDESRRRPRYLIEATTDRIAGAGAADRAFGGGGR